ncbi:nuclear pore complex assembly-domain-containing protein [Umbelopsis sp. PMI_123]|nr:nuclear pore complex assembly-domain-containing protein [Umbelopsis sp. PMI_123]
MTSKHMMDPKIYVGGESGFLNVFKYKVADGNQFIIPSRNLTELLNDQDPVTHIECFRLQDQQKTVIIVGQSPLNHKASNNKARVTVLQTLTNSDRKVLGTFEASNPSLKTWKESSVLAMKSAAPVDLNGNHYLFAVFSTKAQSSASTELVAYKINQDNVDELFRNDISECCYGVTLQDIAPARGASQSLLLFTNKLIKYNGVIEAEPLPDVNNIGSSAKLSAVEEWSHFDEKAFKTCYSSKEVKAIQKQRKAMHGELFLDKLLKFAHVNVSLYPPRNTNDLHKLYNSIQKCDLDILRKHSLVYYLLLDWKNASQARYARRYLIPSQFQKLMDGYWAMDHGQYEDGVKSLTDPGVEADWSDKILLTLYELSSHHLALQYATISKHRSDISEDIILRMKLFVKCDIVRAFYFQVSLSC